MVPFYCTFIKNSLKRRDAKQKEETGRLRQGEETVPRKARTRQRRCPFIVFSYNIYSSVVTQNIQRSRGDGERGEVTALLCLRPIVKHVEETGRGRYGVAGGEWAAIPVIPVTMVTLL